MQLKVTNLPVECGYKTLAEQVDNVSKLAHMSLNIDIKQLNDGDGNEATLMRHHAGWHKTCCIKFNQSLIERLQKRTKENISSPLCTHVQIIVLYLIG